MEDIYSNIKSLIQKSRQIYDEVLLVYEPISNVLCHLTSDKVPNIVGGF